MEKEKRNKLLALIHSQKRAAAIDDEAYVSVLLGIAGVDSASKLETVAQFSAVISALNKVLQQQGKPPMGKSQGLLSPLAWATMKRAEKVLGPSSSTRLAGFLQKMGRKSLEECDDQELRRLQGFLSSIERREHLHGAK